MLWEEMTSNEFERARAESKGTCIIPFGVIEKHGTHLPLSTDMIIGRKIATEASKIEPAVVFPYYYFGQIAEARHVPGTVSIHPELIYGMLDEICREISRNGFKKIIILDSHGGNPNLIKYFIQSSLYREKDFVIYYIDAFFREEDYEDDISKTLGFNDYGGHAGNVETSLIMAIRPDLVNMNDVEQEGLKNFERLKHLGNIYTGIWWYADHPTHFDGEPFSATVKAGEKLIELLSSKVARAIKIIKEDDIAKQLQDEFFSKC